MCDENHYHALDERVDDIDRRLTAVETGVRDMREETRQGFTDVKNQLTALYSERSEWGRTARELVRKIVLWLMWFIPALCGIHYAAEKLWRLGK